MKRDPWMRLAASLRSARPEIHEPPWGFETRVLARWRAATSDDEGFFWEPLLRRAALCAALAVLLAAGMLIVAPETPFEDDFAELELVMDQD